LLEVDKQPVDSIRERLASLFSGSTPESTNWRLDLYFLAGKLGSSAKLKVKRGDQEFTTAYPRVYQPVSQLEWEQQERGLVWDILDKDSEKGIGYIDLTRLTYTEVDVAMESIKETKALVLDLRGNTKGTIFRIAPRLTKRTVTVAKTLTPLMVPSQFLFDDLESSTTITKQICHTLHDVRDWLYNGKLVALISSNTVGRGEHSTLYLKACRPDTKIIGQRSNGATGNVTNIALPGGILLGFTGIGLSNPDGSQVRQGIIPDIIVEDTVESIRDGHDTILEAAIAYLRDAGDITTDGANKP